MAKKKTTKKAASRRPARKTSARKTAKKPNAGRKKASKKASATRKPAQKRAAARAQAPSAPSAPPPLPGPGSFVWHELHSTDPARAKEFYRQLFGWKSSEMEMMPGFMYTTFAHKGQPHAGMMQIDPALGDVKPHWDVYVSVRDVDATAAQCEQLGGEIMIPPHDIPVGRWSMIKDPTGATIAIYKARKK